MPRTATTRNAILGLLALREEWSTWEIARQLRRNMRFFWPRAESRIYDEARRLVEAGLATSDRCLHGRRPRTTYAITDAGREAVAHWLAQPPRGTALECEPILRVLFADLSTRDAVLAAVAQVRADGEAILREGREVGAEYLAGTGPFQDQVHARALVFDFLSHHARMLIEWANRAETAIRLWEHQSPNERATGAISAIGRDLAAFPAPR